MKGYVETMLEKVPVTRATLLKQTVHEALPALYELYGILHTAQSNDSGVPVDLHALMKAAGRASVMCVALTAFSDADIRDIPEGWTASEIAKASKERC